MIILGLNHRPSGLAGDHIVQFPGAGMPVRLADAAGVQHGQHHRRLLPAQQRERMLVGLLNGSGVVLTGLSGRQMKRWARLSFSSAPPERYRCLIRPHHAAVKQKRRREGSSSICPAMAHLTFVGEVRKTSAKPSDNSFG